MLGASLKRSGVFDVDDGPMKCRRLQYNDASEQQQEDDNTKDSNAVSNIDECDPRKPPNFIEFHFSVLQSLYKKPQEEAISLATSLTDATPSSHDGNFDGDNEDTPIQESLWSMIECFLQERVQILHAKQEALCWSGIHKEARLITTSNESSSTLKAGAFEQQAVPTPPSHRTARSPSFLAHYPSLSASQMTSTNPSSKHQPTASSFHIVARLLGKHSKTVSEKLEQQVHTYRFLSAFANERMAILQKQLKRLEQELDDEEQRRLGDLVVMSCDQYQPDRNHRLSSPGTKRKASPQQRLDVVGDRERSRVLALKTKIRLWGLLAADLSGIV